MAGTVLVYTGALKLIPQICRSLTNTNRNSIHVYATFNLNDPHHVNVIELRWPRPS